MYDANATIRTDAATNDVTEIFECRGCWFLADRMLR
jgi:hypothetical protein